MIAGDIEAALTRATERLRGDARAVARPANPSGGPEREMAAAAEHELFAEALLGAAKSRFTEIKTVTAK